ncbi:EamA family transporter [Tumebacillus lipolyticus]|uniref:DMT family transporter n=1 Tax=Tumebacillus lipolyticus TaxID=1280370 RepID=A0ABW5A2M3_9BACL
MSRTVAILFVLIGGASYGLISPVVKHAYSLGYSPGDVTSAQYFMATIVLLLIAAFQFRHFKSLTRRDVLLFCFLGVLSTGTSIFYYLALSELPASLSIVLLFQFAWIVMLIDYLVKRNKPTKAKWVALALIVIGTLFAVDLFHAEWEGVSTKGLVLGLLASLTYSTFLYSTSYVRQGTSPWVNSAIIATVSMVTVFFVFPPTFLFNGTMWSGLWIWALIIGGLGQVIPPVFFNIGIPKVGGGLAGVLTSIELPVAVVAAFFLLHEQVTGVQWVGIVMILLGIAAAEFRRRSRKGFKQV